MLAGQKKGVLLLFVYFNWILIRQITWLQKSKALEQLMSIIIVIIISAAFCYFFCSGIFFFFVSNIALLM